LQSYGPRQSLHPFPPRRSSDLTRLLSPHLRPRRDAIHATVEAKAVPKGLVEIHSGVLGPRGVHVVAPRDQHVEDSPAIHVSDGGDRKSTRLNSSHEWISYAVFC